jgi:hypothetical protein
MFYPRHDSKDQLGGVITDTCEWVKTHPPLGRQWCLYYANWRVLIK